MQPVWNLSLCLCTHPCGPVESPLLAQAARSEAKSLLSLISERNEHFFACQGLWDNSQTKGNEWQITPWWLETGTNWDWSESTPVLSCKIWSSSWNIRENPPAAIPWLANTPTFFFSSSITPRCTEMEDKTPYRGKREAELEKLEKG